MYRFTDLMLCFFVFGFLGWCAEAVILSIREGRFVNRGFLMGPIVPLYGACAAILSAFFERRSLGKAEKNQKSSAEHEAADAVPRSKRVGVSALC